MTERPTRAQRVVRAAKRARDENGEPDPAIYVASAPWPEEDFGGELPELNVYGDLDGVNPRFREVASRGLMLPTSCMEPYKLIQSPVTGLWEPQGRHPHLDLYLPTGVLRERKLDLEWNVGFASSFGEIGLPFDDEVLSGAAFRTVAELDADWAINELLKRAWLLEADRSPDRVRSREFLDQADWPDEVRRALRSDINDDRLWLHPTALRQLAAEMAAAQRLPGRARRALTEYPKRPQLDRMVRGSFAGSALGRLLRSAFAFQSSWHPTELDDDADLGDRALGFMAAARVRFQPWAQHDNKLSFALRQFEVADSHPSLAPHGVKASVFRDELEARTDLEIAELKTFGSVLLLTLQLHAQKTPSTEASLFARLPEGLRQRGLAAIDSWLRMSTLELGQAALDAARSEGGYTGWGSVPFGVQTAFDTSPLVGDGPTTQAAGIHLLAEGLSRLPEVLMARRSGWNEHKVDSHLGRLFEAVVTDEADRLDGMRNLRLYSDQHLKLFFGSGSRPDLILGDGADYLIVEIYGGRPPERVDAGDAIGVRRVLQKYARKLSQAYAAEERLPAFLQHVGAPPRVERSTSLVVVREPLPLNPAYARMLSDHGADPRFFCSAEEFQYLIDLGVQGAGLPSAVAGWQASGTRMPLGRWLKVHGIGKFVDVDPLRFRVNTNEIVRALPGAA